MKLLTLSQLNTRLKEEGLSLIDFLSHTEYKRLVDTNNNNIFDEEDVNNFIKLNKTL